MKRSSERSRSNADHQPGSTGTDSPLVSSPRPLFCDSTEIKWEEYSASQAVPYMPLALTMIRGSVDDRQAAQTKSSSAAAAIRSLEFMSSYAFQRSPSAP